MIDVRNVTKRFEKFTAIDNISLQVEPASICGLIGYNGAGKTTLLKTISGIYKPEKGDVFINGKKVFDNGEARRELFYIPDDLYFPMNSSVAGMERFYAGYYTNFNHDTFRQLLEIFGLDSKARMRSFSKGMQRQTEIALGLSVNAKYLLLDESFDGLDPEKRNITKKLLLEYMAEKECSMIISSHNLNEVSDMCDHVVLLNGKSTKINSNIDDLYAQYATLRVVFDGEAKEEFFESTDYLSLKIDKQIGTVIVNGDIGQAKANILRFNPISVEEFPMTLEEIFLAEMGEKEYDTNTLFK